MKQYDVHGCDRPEKGLSIFTQKLSQCLPTLILSQRKDLVANAARASAGSSLCTLGRNYPFASYMGPDIPHCYSMIWCAHPCFPDLYPQLTEKQPANWVP